MTGREDVDNGVVIVDSIKCIMASVGAVELLISEGKNFMFIKYLIYRNRY